MDDNCGLSDALVGLLCTSVAKAEHSWHIGFDGGTIGLTLECPWRLLVGGAVAFGDCDHEQQFGLPGPVDGEQETRRILSSSPIKSVEVRSGAGDLMITFENGAQLETFNASAGYEAWTVSESEGMGFLVVAQGGGRLEVFLRGEPKSTSGRSSRYFSSA